MFNMFTKKHYINLISIIILLQVNLLFIKDTFFQNLGGEIIGDLIFTAFFLTVLYYTNKFILASEEEKSRGVYYFVILIYTIFLILISRLFFSSDGNFTVNNWIIKFTAGVFPYGSLYAEVYMPFTYYLYMPFYLLGDLRLIIIFGTALILLAVVNHSFYKKELILRMSLVFFLPAIHYAFIFSSAELTVSVILISLFFLLDEFIDEEKTGLKFFTLAVLSGLMLCTNLLMLIPFIISVLFFFRKDFKKIFLFTFISLLACSLLLYPFMKWNSEMFWVYGPFTNSFMQLPLWIYIVLFLVIIYTGWMISDLQELFFSSGVILFAVTFLMYLFNHSHFAELIYCIPFILLSLKEYEVDKFLGKVIDQ